MVTTFERLAKVLNGYVKPANWIERAFASIGSVVSKIPDVTNSDRGKFLGVNSSNNNLGWKAIRQVPAVETTDKGKYLHANSDTGALEWEEAGGSSLPEYDSDDIGKSLSVVDSGETETVTKTIIQNQTVTIDAQRHGQLANDTFDWSSLNSGDDVSVVLNGISKTCTIEAEGDYLKFQYDVTLEEQCTVYNDGFVAVIGIEGDIVISSTAAVTLPVPALEWSEAGGSGGAEIAVFTIDDGAVTAPENFSANTSIVQISINDLLYPASFSYGDKMCSAVQINSFANTLIYHYISFDDIHSSWLYEATEYTLTPATNS